MQISTKIHDVSTIGMLDQRSFTVKAGAHIMSVLSGLYRDPIDAMVREYLTNMLDAYTALKRVNPDATIIPPILKLPTSLNGNLEFRDFGIGMSKETVWNVYATYGESTKNGNNEEVGGFGLGSKTAFCYGDGASWSIESRYEGMKHVFMAFIGTDGVPQLSHVTSMPTDEHSGVSIIIPIKREHHHACQNAAAKYLPHFPMAINVQAASFTVTKPDFIIHDQSWGGLVNKQATQVVVMGNVPYVVDFGKLSTQSRLTDIRTKSYNFFYGTSFVLYADVGSLDIVPSRDSLKYTDRTINQLLDIMIRAVGTLPTHVSKKIEHQPTKWGAMMALRDMKNIRDLFTVVPHPVWRGQKLNVVPNRYNQASVWEMFVDRPAKMKVTAYSNVSDSLATPEVTENPDVLKFRYSEVPLTYVLIDDGSTGVTGLARGLFREKFIHRTYSGRATKYGHKPGIVYVVTTNKSAKELSDMFDGFDPSCIFSVNDLTGTIRVAKAPAKESIYKLNGDKWLARVRIPDDADIKYYVPLEKNVHTGKYRYDHAPIDSLTQLAIALKVLPSHQTVYGIRTDDVGNFDKTKWINLADAVHKATVDYIDRNKTKCANARWFHELIVTDVTAMYKMLEHLTQLNKAPQPFTDFIKNVQRVKDDKNDVTFNLISRTFNGSTAPTAKAINNKLDLLTRNITTDPKIDMQKIIKEYPLTATFIAAVLQSGAPSYNRSLSDSMCSEIIKQAKTYFSLSN